jgi:hypothetical protein
MSTTAVMERQIKGDRKPRINLCGDCGCCIPQNELLCSECRVSILAEDTNDYDIEDGLGVD